MVVRQCGRSVVARKWTVKRISKLTVHNHFKKPIDRSRIIVAATAIKGICEDELDQLYYNGDGHVRTSTTRYLLYKKP